MERCPPEIHAYIFELACTDGGATGAALAAVSRYVRAASAPYQWYTLAVAGATQTALLAARIEALAHQHQHHTKHHHHHHHHGKVPAITHLFASNRTPARARELRYAELGAARDLGARRRVEAAFNDEAAHWVRAVRVLLAHAAPTLRSLALVAFDVHVAPGGRLGFGDLLARTRFPRLAELTLRGGFDARVRDYPDPDSDPGAEGESREAAAEEAVALPALRRLHLASPVAFDTFLQRLRPHAPRLSHVRLSELLAFDYDLARALHSELAARGAVPPRLPGLRERQWAAEPTAAPVDWEPYLPPAPGALARLVLQPAALPPAPERLCGCCSGYYRADDMARLLREMAREAADATYVFVPPAARHGAYGLCDARRDWLARTAGGRGCWVEQDEVDIDAEPAGAADDAPEAQWEGGGGGGVKRAISRAWL